MIAPVARGESSGHRICTEADPDLLTGIACLAAAGMSVRDMRDYVETGRLGPDAAEQQISLLRERAERLAEEARLVRMRRKYVGLKIGYWQAVAAGDAAGAERPGGEARALLPELEPGR